ncbi:hypothetical protein HK100_004807 [Physocladia obscura]|uniref:Alkaline phosphatase D n=1 Tax=Physocladia obscura TaxID=109957 RepID=A0AAD5SSF8_9FUNG|nr:hypothetical protein HK100_004807 [Physocladia obscura]
MGSIWPHEHPKRTLFLVAMFLITSAKFSSVAEQYIFKSKSLEVFIDNLSNFLSPIPETEVLQIHENLVYQHASEMQFLSQWLHSHVSFNTMTSNRFADQQSEQKPPFCDSKARFLHGVASGDTLSDRVILWTKVTPPPQTRSFYVRYDISLSQIAIQKLEPGTPPSRIGPSIFSGAVLTGPEVDYIVKIELTGLSPKTEYFYQFSVASNLSDYRMAIRNPLITSPAGRTKTLPDASDDSISAIQFAVVSCSNWPRGFFTAYKSIAERQDVDFVLHLGDYIYEYRNGEYGDGSSIGRIPRPDRTLLTLEDYRERHAQYKEDRDLQALHRNKPWIVIWDDHEFVDDISGLNSNQNIHSNETLNRIPEAMRAYFEYLPIRVKKNFRVKHLPPPTLQKQNNSILLTHAYDPNTLEKDGMQLTAGIYRDFQFGTLLDLIMLDTRIIGRDLSDWANLKNESRSILGDDQEEWLIERLKASSVRGADWRIIGNQVVFAQIDYWGLMFNGDAWDGYPANRKRVLDAIEKNDLKDVIVLTGDVHAALTFDVPKSMETYDPKTGQGSLLVEFVTPAISSPSPLESIHIGFLNPLAEYFFPKIEPHLKFIDLSRRGYMLLKIGKERTVCEYYFLQNVRRRDSAVSIGAVVETERGSGRITRVQKY